MFKHVVPEDIWGVNKRRATAKVTGSQCGWFIEILIISNDKSSIGIYWLVGMKMHKRYSHPQPSFFSSNHLYIPQKLMLKSTLLSNSISSLAFCNFGKACYKAIGMGPTKQPTNSSTKGPWKGGGKPYNYWFWKNRRFNNKHLAGNSNTN